MNSSGSGLGPDAEGETDWLDEALWGLWEALLRQLRPLMGPVLAAWEWARRAWLFVLKWAMRAYYLTIVVLGCIGLKILYFLTVTII